MRGFIKILESIIASIIILSAATFFFSFQRAPDGQAKFNYAIAALQKNGSLNDYVNSSDAGALNTTLRNMLPPTVDFSVEISGIPNSVTTVACVCSSSEKDDLISRLGSLDFRYRNRTLHIRVDNGNLNDMATSNANVLFFFGPRTFAPAEQTLLRKFLDNGTLFMLANLEQADVDPANPSVVMDDLFGLEWDGDIVGTGPGTFSNAENPGTIAYIISRYYGSLGGSRTEAFNFHTPEPDMNKIKTDSRTIIVDSGRPKSLLKINKEIIGNRGRAVWLRNYDPGAADGPKINNLLKASVLWASGERYRLDPQFKIVPAGQPFRQYSYIGVLDEFEAFLVSLKVWNVFF